MGQVSISRLLDLKRPRVQHPLGNICNSVGRRCKKPDSVPRHIRDRETPASLYVAMEVYLQTGHECLIDDMHQGGMCILYDRLRDIANSVIGHWEQVGMVVDPQAVKSIFTTGGFDNIDYNPSSTTAKAALHGTCISIRQNFSSNIQQVENLDDILNNNITIIICRSYISLFLGEASSKCFAMLGPLNSLSFS